MLPFYFLLFFIDISIHDLCMVLVFVSFAPISAQASWHELLRDSATLAKTLGDSQFLFHVVGLKSLVLIKSLVQSLRLQSFRNLLFF